MVPWWLLFAAGLYATAAAVRGVFLEDWLGAAIYAVLGVANFFFAMRNRRLVDEPRNDQRKKT